MMKDFFFRPLFFLFTLLLLVGCTEPFAVGGNTSGGSEGETEIEISGVAQLGPIKQADVVAYLLNSDGTRGSSVGSTQTDASGAYTLRMGPGLGNLEIVVSGGSYVEEAGGATVDMTGKEIIALVESLSESSQVSVTPLSHIAAKRAKKMREEGVDVGEAIVSARNQIAEVSGVQDILAPPANPEGSLDGQDENARKYAVFLAGISKMAEDSGINSLEASNAFANDFQTDGSFDGSDDGSNVLLGSSGTYLGNDDWSTDLDAAINNFIASGDNTAGFVGGDALDPINDPVLTVIPVPIYDPLPPMINDPMFFAIEAPIPFPVGVCVPVNMLILDAYFAVTPLQEDSLLVNLTPFDPYLAQFFDDPSCMMEMSGPLPIPAGTDMVQLFVRINSTGYLEFHNFLIEPLSGQGNILYYMNTNPIFADPFAPGSMVPMFYDLVGQTSMTVGECVPYQLQLFDGSFNPVQLYNGGELIEMFPNPAVYELHMDSSCLSPTPVVPIGMSGVADTIYIKATGPGVIDLMYFDIFSYGYMAPMPLAPSGMTMITVF